MPEFSYTDLLPTGEDTTEYRQLMRTESGWKQRSGRNSCGLTRVR